MTITEASKNEFMVFDPNAIESVYIGADRACRCGCKGQYAYKGDRMFTIRLARFMRMAEYYTPLQEDIDSYYRNISYGNNRAMTVYLGKGGN